MPKTLLLADDSVTIQKVVGITFANEDVELVTVDNGDDALPRARQVKPDLILADIGMPGLNGYELCAAIRRDPNLSHIPVLLLTGTFETYDEQKAREVGASGHIAKPFEAQALVDRVFQLLSQAPPKPAALPPTPPEVIAPPQSPVVRPAAAPIAPVRPPAPMQPRPAPPAALPSTPVARARPELPPVPHAPSPSALPPRPAPAAAPAPASRTVVPAPKRETTPFEFELPDVPSAPTSLPSGAAALADQEPVWEAEPEADVIADDSAFGVANADLHAHASDEPLTSDATRLFAPDLLGRAAQLPEVPEPPRAPAARKGDFSFGDLDFEEPTSPASNQSGIFGESSEPSASEFEPEFVQGLPADAPLEVEALADPLYSQTAFLEPAGADGGARRFAGPNPAAPPLPDLLEPTPEPHAGDDADEELELAEADTALDDDPSETTDPLAKPFSPDTAAALAKPRFERPLEPIRAPEAATRLAWDDEPTSPPPARPMPASPARVAAAEADTLPPRVQREPAPSPAPVSAARASAIVDSTLLAQSVEKVAWEAFGALSEQVVGEVLKRVEAVVWEVVPQLCERLIREEIARLKAEMSD